MKKYFFLSALFLTVTFYSFGQIKDIGTMMAGSTADAEKLLQEYFKPYGNAFGANLSSGWYNTAKNHKLLGFDLTFSITASFIPKADKEFDISTLGLSNNPTSAMSPTIAGKKVSGANMNYDLGGGKSLSYKLPQGTGWGIIPSPMLQFGLGLVKGTDITFRYVPDLNIGDFGEFGLWGVGIKHSIKQYIPAIKMMPFFNLSVFMGYTKMHTSANLSFQPEVFSTIMTPSPTIPATPAGTYDNQRLEMLFTGFTSSVLVSFDLPVVTFYGGAGFANTKTNLELLGNYPLLNETATAIAPSADPLSIKITSSTGTKPRLNAGIKFKMAIITFHVDYTYASYSLVSTGLGISFR